jgi:SAM-dependent methyltransferase
MTGSGDRFPPLAIRAQLRWDVVRPIIARLSPSTTIEVGVGQGAMSARIAAMTTRSYTGFEVDETSYERAKVRLVPFGGVVHNGELRVIDPPPAALLCAFEILEHIEDDKGALKEWAQYIEPGGHLLMSVPAHPHRFGPMDVHAGHFRRYSQAGIEELVGSIGMADISTVFYGAPLGYALEAVRNRIDARKLAKARAAGVTNDALTAASGRTFQFDHPSWASMLATAGTTPFRYGQRVWPGGVGLVLLARKPPGR